MRLNAQLNEYAYAHSDYACIGIGFGGSSVVGRGCLPIDEYDFLAEINPSQNVIIARYESDGLLYVCWPELGYRIKLDEFTVG